MFAASTLHPVNDFQTLCPSALLGLCLFFPDLIIFSIDSLMSSRGAGTIVFVGNKCPCMNHCWTSHLNSKRSGVSLLLGSCGGTHLVSLSSSVDSCPTKTIKSNSHSSQNVWSSVMYPGTHPPPPP